MRSYRDRETGEDVWIRVVVILCTNARAEGLQYTKRMLPDFLIPFSRIRLDRVIEAAEEKEGGETIEHCSLTVGCMDLQTTGRLLNRLEEAAAAVALNLGERQAGVPHLSDAGKELKESLHPLSPLERTKELYRREQEVLLRAGRGEVNLPSLRHLLQTALWKNSRKVSMSCPSRSPPKPCYLL
jgi:hypothetical protein